MAEPAFKYRVATADDHAVVVQLLCELVDELGPAEMADRVKPLFDNDIKLALASPAIRVFLAEQQGKAVGLSRADILTEDPIFRLRLDQRCGYVDQMFVQPAYRDQGLGGRLITLCEDWFREQDIAHAMLHAAPKAVRFYARIGYQPNREMFKRL